MMNGDLRYKIRRPDGTLYRWCDFCEGWADAPIRLRREGDARHAAAMLREKFGAAIFTSDGSDGPHRVVRERVPTSIDKLDAQLALWIAESQAKDEKQ